MVVDGKSRNQPSSSPKLHMQFTRTEVKLSSKAVQGPALPLQGINDIHGSDCLPLGMLGVGDSITDDILQENLENTPGFLIDKATDPLHTTPPCESANCRLSDALDVVPQHLTMPLGTTLAQAFTSLASSSHADCLLSVGLDK